MAHGIWGLSVLGFWVCFSCGTDKPYYGTPPGEAGANAGGDESAAGAPSKGASTSNGGGPASAGEGGASGEGGATGGVCQGDAELWATITAAPPECESADDCCVVVNACLAEAQIVHAYDFEPAQTAWPYCEDECTDCIPPVVTVACDNGHCVGTTDPESVEDGVSHCGDTAAIGDEPAQAFSCGG